MRLRRHHPGTFLHPGNDPLLDIVVQAESIDTRFVELPLTIHTISPRRIKESRKYKVFVSFNTPNPQSAPLASSRYATRTYRSAPLMYYTVNTAPKRTTIMGHIWPGLLQECHAGGEAIFAGILAVKALFDLTPNPP